MAHVDGQYQAMSWMVDDTEYAIKRFGNPQLRHLRLGLYLPTRLDDPAELAHMCDEIADLLRMCDARLPNLEELDLQIWVSCCPGYN